MGKRPSTAVPDADLSARTYRALRTLRELPGVDDAWIERITTGAGATYRCVATVLGQTWPVVVHRDPRVAIESVTRSIQGVRQSAGVQNG